MARKEDTWLLVIAGALLTTFTTISATLEARKREMKSSDLPKTYQEAVFIAVKLGVEYLWIDSLFILQDSRYDWERESSKMAGVYAKSYLTTSASTSKKRCKRMLCISQNSVIQRMDAEI
jgi:hypothetical protein